MICSSPFKNEMSDIFSEVKDPFDVLTNAVSTSKKATVATVLNTVINKHNLLQLELDTLLHKKYFNNKCVK